MPTVATYRSNVAPMRRVSKTALLTGATSDIGAASAKHLARAGFNLLLSGRRIERLEGILHGPESSGRCVLIRADIGSLDGVETLARSARDQLNAWGATLSALIHVAGVWHDDHHAFVGQDFLRTDIAEIEKVLNATLLGAVYLTRQVLDLMPCGQDGKIIGISGTFPGGGAGWLHYFVAKQALELFLTGLAAELEKDRIQVNCVSPSYVATEPLKQFLPNHARTALVREEVAEVVDFLISPAARNITGQVIVVKSSRA